MFLTITASLMIYCPHLRFVGELEVERRETSLSASRASCSNAGCSDIRDCTRLHWQNDLGVLYKIRLQAATLRRGRGVKEAATRVDVIMLFPAAACSVWQDTLYTQSLPEQAPYQDSALRGTSSSAVHISTATHFLCLRLITSSSLSICASVKCDKSIGWALFGRTTSR
jgi:hypothetical protein